MWVRRLLPWLAVSAYAFAAERAGTNGAGPEVWLPDLVCGWTLLACGLLRRTDRAGWLLISAGVLWFAGNLGLDALAFAHRGPLVQALVGRPRTRGQVAVVLAGYVIALVPLSDAGTLAAGIVLVVAAFTVARPPLALLGAGLAGAALVRLTTSDDQLALALYEAAVWLAAVEVLLRRHDRLSVADLVVELGGAPSPTLRDALADALDDPSLEVLPAAPREPAPGRAVTVIDREGEAVAAIVHDPAVNDDPVLVDALAAATRLDADNARLRAGVTARVEELRASRRRLLAVSDEERRRLEERLREGAERHLEALQALLDGARVRSAELERAQQTLNETRADLRLLAQGLHPRALADGGLTEAVRGLAPPHAVVEIDAPPLPAAVEAAVYFVCAEALTNVAKHAQARTVTVTVRASASSVWVRVRDDGIGGALPAGGLRGLADRVQALDGTLTVESPPGGGTLLRATLPLSRPR